MSLWIWGLAFLLLGFVVYLVGPLLIAPVLPYRVRRSLAKSYWKQSVITADRPQIVERKHGGLTLIATDFKPAWGEEGTVDDENGHWRDELGLMGRLFQRPIGFAPEGFNIICDPMHCELGRAHKRWYEEDEYRQTVQTEKGTIDGFNPGVFVPETASLVSLHDIDGVIGGQADPMLGEIEYDYVEKSQSKFGNRSMVEMMAFIMAFAAAFGMVWFFAEQAPSTGVSNVTLFVEVFL